MHPEKKARDIVNDWLALNISIPNIVETAEQHEQRRALSNDPIFDRRSYNLDLKNGERVFISNQYRLSTINDFIEKVNDQDWGIHIEKIN